MRYRCLIDRGRVVGANYYNKDAFFTLWFNLTNLCCLRVGVYEKEVDKLSWYG